MKSGLLSITFRKLTIDEIIKLAVKAGVDGIEWGGDIHCPPGNIEVAKETAYKSRKAGLEVFAYGSYYRTDPSKSLEDDFIPVLETAVAMGAPIVRVWAGGKGSNDVSIDERKLIVELSRNIAELASKKKIRVACEYHAGTLTDSPESAAQFLSDVNHPNYRSLWQPINGASFETVMHSLDLILPFLEHVHVFHWWPDPSHRHPLIDGADRWIPILEKVKNHCSSHNALIEFVKGDDPKQFLEDAKVLNNWIGNILL